MIESCHTGLQSNNALLDSHFPGSTNVAQEPTPPFEETREENIKLYIDFKTNYLSFLNPNRVKEAFKNMKALNSGGPDKSKSVVSKIFPTIY